MRENQEKLELNMKHYKIKPNILMLSRTLRTIERTMNTSAFEQLYSNCIDLIITQHGVIVIFTFLKLNLVW